MRAIAALVALTMASALVGTAHALCPAPAPAELAGSFRDVSISVPGFENDPIYGSKPAFLYIPSSYQPTRPIALFILLHGTAGTPTLAIGQASTFRGLWASAAEAGGFIVAAPVASGTVGGWIAPVNEIDTPSDYAVIYALSERLARDYNIDRDRRYLWGFSSGGHVAIDIALNRSHRQINGDYFAGFSVNAGVSAGLACAGMSAELCSALVFGGGHNHRPFDVRIGQSDSLLSRTLEDRSRFLNNGWNEGLTFFWQPFSGGHTVLSNQPLQIWNNLCGFHNGTGKLPEINTQPLRRRVDSQNKPGTATQPTKLPRQENLGLRPQARKR